MYSNWRIKELKDELKKCGASLRGRKADLVERLELYDQNFNFGHPECVDDEDPKMQLPINETFRDINSNTILPPIDKTMIRHYLNYTEKKMNIAHGLYESRHLLMARSTVLGDYTFIKGYCKKTMRNLQYEINIKINKNGNPEESHCECPAGSGVNAVCKHVAVLLIALVNVVTNKIMLVKEVCTQKLQQFHMPKKMYTGTPVRAEKLNKMRNTEKIIFEPYPVKNLNKDNYNVRIRNLIIGFPSHMPLKQLYMAANPYALSTDHNYTGINIEDELLKSFKLSNITLEEINCIERNSLLQRECTEWHEYRKHRLTASNFHTIFCLKTSSMPKYAKQTITKKDFVSRATSHGIINEKIALAKYSVEYDLNTEPCGIYISKERPYLAASPDAILGDETVIEIKCPYASRFQYINTHTLPYLEKINGTLVLKKTSPYYYQVQGQLYCSGRSYCNIIIYTYKEMKVKYIEKNNYFIKEMLSKLDIFYNNFFKKALFEKYIYDYGENE